MTGGVHEHMRAWEPEEDNTIIRLLGEMGPKWSRIVQQLPGRSVSSVRNRWQRIEKGRKLREAGHESKNRCQRCGHPKRGHVCSAKLKTRSEVSDTASITSDEVTVDLEVPLVRRASSDAVLFPSEAVAAACASPGMSTSGAMLSPASRNSGTVDGAVYGGAYRRFFPGEAAASAPAPILGRMKSEGRICSELGFEALAAAASLQLAAQAEATASILVPVHISKQMSATPAVPPLAAMPSLIHMSSYETFANAERLPCDVSALVPSLNDEPPPISVSSTEEGPETGPTSAPLSFKFELSARSGRAYVARVTGGEQPGELEAPVSSGVSCEG